MKVTIQKAKLSDISHLMKLWGEMMEYHSRLSKKDFEMVKKPEKIVHKWFAKNIKSRNAIVLKAVSDAKIVGYLLAFIDKFPPVYKVQKYGYISDLAVKKDYRKKGIAHKMVKEAIKFFRAEGMKELQLRVYSKNVVAVNAWFNMGFIENSKLMSKRL